MKKYLFVIGLLIFAVSCGKKANNKLESGDVQTTASISGEQLVVDTTMSVVHWKGTKIGGEHVGTLKLKSGELIVNGNEASGSFVVDMNTIVDKDLTDKAMNDMLVGHLKSKDFFDVATYPESSFAITKIEEVPNGKDSVSHMISGNLKLKDVERNITFSAKISKDGDLYKAETLPFTIDRTQWNVKFGSKTLFPDLKDKIVDDNIELQITIVAKAK